MNEKLGIAGTGAIACGLAVVAALHGDVAIWARSSDSVARAKRTVARIREKMEDPPTGELRIETGPDVLAGATYVVEAIVEDLELKGALLHDLGGRLPEDAILATTTSSLAVDRLAVASARPERFAGLHVFNPVQRMELVELVFPDSASWETRARTRKLCDQLGKTAVEVPDIPGFVVNRLLFPYLFNAVLLLEETGMEPQDVDVCMKLGAGHPLGPLALLDLVGIDVAQAIGRTIGAVVPARIDAMVEEGRLGRKTGAGFYHY